LDERKKKKEKVYKSFIMPLLHILNTSVGYPSLPRTISQYNCEIVPCRLIYGTKGQKWAGRGQGCGWALGGAVGEAVGEAVGRAVGGAVDGVSRWVQRQAAGHTYTHTHKPIHT